MQSKLRFRNVYPDIAKEKYDQVQPATSSSDSCLIKGNPKYLSFAWKAGGGGSLAVLDINKPQRLPPIIPLIKGHTGAIQDQDFNPFNDNVIATSSDDTTLKIWEIPEDFSKDVTESLVTLQGHGRKVNFVQWHPTTDQVLASASNDSTVKVWDVEKQTDALTISAPDANYWSLAWNTNGSLLGTAAKDKMTRIGDPRAQQWVSDVLSHEGSRAQKMTFLGDTGLILTVGFAKTHDREFKVWDLKNLKEPVQSVKIDQQASTLYPFYDADVGMLYLAGRGDGNIRYYEFSEGTFTYTSDHRSTVPQKGIGFIPKRGVDVMRAELMRALKLTDNYIEFISFIQPRKAQTFQEDLYPDCLSDIPAQQAEAWFAGNNAEPLRKSMKPSDTSSPTQKPVTRPSYPTTTHSGSGEVEKLQKALDDARAEIEKLKAQQNDNESAQYEVEKLKNDLRGVHEERAALEEKIARQDAEIHELQAQIHERNNFTEDNHYLHEQISQLTAQLKAVEEQNAALKDQYEYLEARNQELRGEIEALRGAN